MLILDGALRSCATPGLNTDIRSGDFRNSGLYLEAAPFNAALEVLLTYPSDDGAEQFRLVRYRGR